jgi:hypothetical protein
MFGKSVLFFPLLLQLLLFSLSNQEQDTLQRANNEFKKLNQKKEKKKKQNKIIEDTKTEEKTLPKEKDKKALEEEVKKELKIGIESLSQNQVMKTENLKILNKFRDYFMNTYSLKTNMHGFEEMEAKQIDDEMEREGILEMRKENRKDEYIPGRGTCIPNS